MHDKGRPCMGKIYLPDYDPGREHWATEYNSIQEKLFNMKFNNLRSSIVYINKTGEISEYTRLQSLLGPGNPFFNRGGYLNIPAINLDIKAIQSKISFTSLGGVGQ